jgi:hypothetical protein
MPAQPGSDWISMGLTAVSCVKIDECEAIGILDAEDIDVGTLLAAHYTENGWTDNRRKVPRHDRVLPLGAIWCGGSGQCVATQGLVDTSPFSLTEGVRDGSPFSTTVATLH